MVDLGFGVDRVMDLLIRRVLRDLLSNCCHQGEFGFVRRFYIRLTVPSCFT